MEAIFQNKTQQKEAIYLINLIKQPQWEALLSFVEPFVDSMFLIV